MEIIGLSGKIGSGKTTIGLSLRDKFEEHNLKAKVFSFSNYLKMEVNKLIKDYHNSDIFRLTEVQSKYGIEDLDWYELAKVLSRTKPSDNGFKKTKDVRTILQKFGAIRRKQNENYWVDKLSDVIFSQDLDFAIIDDVRFDNEKDFIFDRKGKIFRLVISDEEREKRLDLRDGYSLSIEQKNDLSERELKDDRIIEIENIDTKTVVDAIFREFSTPTTVGDLIDILKDFDRGSVVRFCEDFDIKEYVGYGLGEVYIPKTFTKPSNITMHIDNALIVFGVENERYY